MAAPIRGQRDDPADAEPLKVVKITAQFDPAYRDGDPFTLSCQLNRTMNAFEERILREGTVRLDPYSTFGVSMHVEVISLDDFDLENFQGALQDLSELAAAAASASAREVDQVRSGVRSLNLELKLES